MRLVAAREGGVAAAQPRWIGAEPELFEAFYRENVEDVQRFVARRVGDRERAADLTAEIPAEQALPPVSGPTEENRPSN